MKTISYRLFKLELKKSLKHLTGNVIMFHLRYRRAHKRVRFNIVFGPLTLLSAYWWRISKRALTLVIILVLEDIVKLKFSLQTWRWDNISSQNCPFLTSGWIYRYGWTHSFAYIYLLRMLNKQLERACFMWIFGTKHKWRWILKMLNNFSLEKILPFH